jgi:hypothetical protein
VKLETIAGRIDRARALEHDTFIVPSGAGGLTVRRLGMLRIRRRESVLMATLGAMAGLPPEVSHGA